MIGKSTPSFSYFEILDACQEPACPVCSLGHAAARRNVNTLIYEGVNDYGLRAKLRESLGYCHEHAWLLPEAGESAALGIAIVHRDLLNTIRERLENIKYDKAKGESSDLLSQMQLVRTKGQGKQQIRPDILLQRLPVQPA